MGLVSVPFRGFRGLQVIENNSGSNKDKIKNNCRHTPVIENNSDNKRAAIENNLGGGLKKNSKTTLILPENIFSDSSE